MSEIKRVNDLYLKFQKVEEDLSELREEIDKANGKLDMILQHLTGMNDK